MDSICTYIISRGINSGKPCGKAKCTKHDPNSICQFIMTRGKNVGKPCGISNCKTHTTTTATTTTTTSSDVPVNQEEEEIAIVKGDEYKIQPEFRVYSNDIFLTPTEVNGRNVYIVDSTIYDRVDEGFYIKIGEVNNGVYNIYDPNSKCYYPST